MVVRRKPLPPRFGLHSVGQATGLVLIWCSAHHATESVRPACKGQEGAQHRSAEKLVPGSDLRRDRDLAQPSVVLTTAVRVVEPSLDRKREMFGEEVFRSGAKRDPLVPVVVRIAVLGPLVNEDRHNGELFVWLKQQVFCDEKSLRTVDERRWIRDRRTEVAGRSGSVLEGKRVIATVPLQALMAQPKCVSVRCTDHSTVGGRAAFRGGIIEPPGPKTHRPL